MDAIGQNSPVRRNRSSPIPTKFLTCKQISAQARAGTADAKCESATSGNARVMRKNKAPQPSCCQFIRSERVDRIMDTKSLLSVYSVVSGEGGRDLWVEIGHAIPHHDGRGFDLTLRALPLEPRLVLREPSQGVSEDAAEPSLASQVREFERATIRQCLLETGGNIGAALERLKIPRRTLNEKMARLGIDRRRLTPPLRHSDTSKSEHAERGVESAGGEPDAFIEQPRWGANGAANGQSSQS